MAKNRDDGGRLPRSPRSRDGRQGTAGRADIRALAQSQGASFPPTAADWNFYSEQIRKTRYALDNDQLKPYFEFNKVLNDGVFYAANQLYGLTFTKRTDMPTWNPDMQVFEVHDQDGKPLALFYIDPWKRDNKAGGAWMSNLVNQSYMRGTQPVVFNVENFTKPAPGQPALISFDDVTTMFHEFGHALHGMFAARPIRHCRAPMSPATSSSSRRSSTRIGRSIPRCCRTTPSITRPASRLPQALVDKIKAARTFNQGYENGEVLEAAGSISTGIRCLRTRRCRTSTSSRPRRSPAAGSTSPTFRRAIARATSCTSGATAIRRAITPIRGPGCSARTRSTGSRLTAA